MSVSPKKKGKGKAADGAAPSSPPVKRAKRKYDSVSSKDPVGGIVIETPADGYAGGCMVGSTLVARLNTKMVPIQELFEKGGKPWVFIAHRPPLISGFIIAGSPSIVQRVQQQTELMRVVLDNDKEIICSPDYQLLTIEGLWCKAADLDEDVLLEAFDTQENRFHQIQFTEKLDYVVEDAYRLVVHYYGNFALAAGVYARGIKGKLVEDGHGPGIVPMKVRA